MAELPERPPALRRRGLLGLAGGLLLPADSHAQPRPPAVVRPVPPPCPARPGDIVGLVLEGSGAPSGTIVVFGQAFRPGDLPPRHGLAARLADGRALPAQTDITTRHADGSARFAIVSLAAPALRAGERVGVLLATTTAEPPPPLDVIAAAAGRSATIEIAPDATTPPWRVDLLLRLQDALLNPPPRALWQRGLLAVQARLQLPVPPSAVGGATSARLVCDLSLRADRTLWADVWLRNDIAMRPGGGAVQHAMRLLLDGREAFATGPVRQFQYTGFGRLAGSAGASAAPVPPLVRHDVAYLADAGALHRYDLSTGVEERFLERMAQAMAAPDWHEPLSPRRIARGMPMAGNREDIGPTTRWQAAWLLTGDRRAAEFCIGQAEAAGAVPWHFWDAGGGADGRGGWLDTNRWPQFWSDPRGGQPPRTLLQPVARHTETGWQPDTAHKPALGFVPYLLTGRRALLDSVLAEGFWGIVSSWPARRAEFAAVPAVRDLNVVAGSQIRGAAWSLRCLDNAAWIAPDDDQHSAYLRGALAANWAWVRAMTARWGAMQGEARGWIFGNYVVGARGDFSPWQQDFFVSSAVLSARRGSQDARAVLAWMENYVAGRFLSAAAGFNPRDGIAYVIAIAPGGGPNPAWHQTWAEIGAATREKDLSNGDGWRRSVGYYGPLGLFSLAGMAEILDSTAARRAYAWLAAAAPPYADARNFAADPTYNALPPGERGGPCVPAPPRR
jgi:hypothetical protein